MTWPKPVLGYRRQVDAVLAMRRDQVPTSEIAARLGVAVDDVAALESSAARVRPESPGRGVLFPLELLAALAPHAARRGIHPHSLARKLIEVVLAEEMLDAVLDDAEALT